MEIADITKKAWLKIILLTMMGFNVMLKELKRFNMLKTAPIFIRKK